MTDPNFKQAVDLSKAAKSAAAQRELNEEAAIKKAETHVAAWDKAMTRTFKGIFPRSTRRIFMRAAIKQDER